MSSISYIAIQNGLYKIGKPICTVAIIGITVKTTIKSMEAFRSIDKYKKYKPVYDIEIENGLDVHNTLY
jgi:hypothetical protein